MNSKINNKKVRAEEDGRKLPANARAAEVVVEEAILVYDDFNKNRDFDDSLQPKPMTGTPLHTDNYSSSGVMFSESGGYSPRSPDYSPLTGPRFTPETSSSLDGSDLASHKKSEAEFAKLCKMSAGETPGPNGRSPGGKSKRLNSGGNVILTRMEKEGEIRAASLKAYPLRRFLAGAIAIDGKMCEINWLLFYVANMKKQLSKAGLSDEVPANMRSENNSALYFYSALTGARSASEWKNKIQKLNIFCNWLEEIIGSGMFVDPENGGFMTVTVRKVEITDEDELALQALFADM